MAEDLFEAARRQFFGETPPINRLAIITDRLRVLVSLGNSANASEENEIRELSLQRNALIDQCERTPRVKRRKAPGAALTSKELQSLGSPWERQFPDWRSSATASNNGTSDRSHCVPGCPSRRFYEWAFLRVPRRHRTGSTGASPGTPLT